MGNDVRFAQVMCGLSEAAKAFRKQKAQSLMELDGAWHAFHLAVGPNRELSPKLSSRELKEETETEAANVSQSVRGRNSKSFGMSTLTLNVSTHGLYQKRYSII